MTRYPKKFALGFTITELLVALFLASIVTLIVFTLFVNNTRSTQFTNELSNVHKSVRLTQLLLNRELLNANNLGCKTGTYSMVNNIEIPAGGARPAAWDFPLSFTAINGAPGEPDSFEFVAVAADDMSLETTMATASSNLHVSKIKVSGEPIDTTDTLLITDCDHGDIFVPTQVKPAAKLIEHKIDTSADSASVAVNTNSYTDPACTDHCLSTAYLAGTKVHKLVKKRLCLEESCNIAGFTPESETLYIVEGSNDPQAWIKGVVDLQLEYGLDSNNSDKANLVDEFVSAPSAAQMKQVRSVKVYVLFGSNRGGIVELDADGDGTVDTDKTFKYADHPDVIDLEMNNGQGRYYYLLESVIQFRNRVGGQQ